MVTPKLELPSWWYTDGAKIITKDIERFIPGAKSTNYLTAVWALQEAHRQDAIESIGQLQYVDVVRDDGTLQRRYIQTGRIGEPGRVEVLSGLDAGERVVLHP